MRGTNININKSRKRVEHSCLSVQACLGNVEANPGNVEGPFKRVEQLKLEVEVIAAVGCSKRLPSNHICISNLSS